MTSQISGPYCDSDIELDQYKSFVWESHVRQQIFVAFEDFISVIRSRIQLDFDNIYPENNQRVPRQGFKLKLFIKQHIRLNL